MNSYRPTLESGFVNQSSELCIGILPVLWVVLSAEDTTGRNHLDTASPSPDLLPDSLATFIHAVGYYKSTNTRPRVAT
jgi:hypothetical protein